MFIGRQLAVYPVCVFRFGVSLKPEKLRAAVVGLGKAGSRFDEEDRPAIWSHVGAYLRSSDIYKLVGGADPDHVSRAALSRRCPDLPCFETAADLVSTLRPDVVSIATPVDVRSQVFREVLGGAYTPRVIICEKPLAVDPQTRQLWVEACAAREVVLIVHYNRRYASIYQRMRMAIVEGLVGEVTSITIRMANRLWSVGSHAFDLLFYLSGEEPCQWRALEIPALFERGEPAVDFVSFFPSGAAGRVLVHGPARVLLFEADVVGTRGRLTASGNGERLDFVPFLSSTQYQGYVAAGPMQCLHTTPPDESTFVAVVREAAAVLNSGKQATCTGHTARRSEAIMDQVLSRSSE